MAYRRAHGWTGLLGALSALLWLTAGPPPAATAVQIMLLGVLPYAVIAWER